MIFGIDVSKWQGNFDFGAAVKEGVKFAIIKGGGGDSGLYVDSKFLTNYTNAKKKALPVGAYWFSKALTVEEAEKEAEYFYKNVLEDRQFELPVYMDVEHKAMLALGKSKLTEIVKAWCEYLEKRGFWVGIYSSKAYFKSYMNDSDLQNYAHWVAQWDTKCTYPNADCLGMWQFGGETNKIRTNKVSGVVCDQNYMLVDYPVKIKAAGKNGFAKVAPKSVDDLAKEVLSGAWGDGAERKKNLIAAGHDYAKVQARVNEILIEQGKKSVDTIAREIISGKWGNGRARANALKKAGYSDKEIKAIQKRVNELF